jgi:hypothetical protein
MRKRTQETRSEPARESLHPERVELEAGRRNKASLDAVRRTGEADGHAALRERLRDCERG